MVPRVGQLSPSEERIWDLRDVECSFPVGDKRPPEPLVSVSPRLLSLPFWPLAASEPTFRQLWPLPFVLSSSLFFFSPLSLSLSWNLLLSPLLSVPSCFYLLHLRERTLSHNSITPLSLWDLHLLASSEWQAEERLASHQSDLGPVLPEWRFTRWERFKPHIM